MCERFNASDFSYHGGYLHYTTSDGVRRFVARFKYGGVRPFKKFLRDRFFVADYFNKLNSGLAPLEIVNARGYVSPNRLRLTRSFIPTEKTN